MNAVIQPAELPALICKARSLLDDDAVLAEKELAGQAYNQAKDAVSLGRRFKAADELIERSRRLQGEALLIESQAKIRMADDWDKGQENGTNSAKGGRPKTVADGNGFTAEEIGLSRKEIHEARKLRDKERTQPGIIERAIAARIEQGLEPSKASLKANVGTKTASKEDRGVNLYETHQVGIDCLLKRETFSDCVDEPACGRGAISRRLEGAGYQVKISDLVDYGTVTEAGQKQAVADFLKRRRRKTGYDIITNPPYGEYLNRFVRKAVEMMEAGCCEKVAMLMNINVLCGCEDRDRIYWREEVPPARIYYFTRRLPMMHRDGWEGPKAESSMNTARFIWERDFLYQPVSHFIDWAEELDLDPRRVRAGDV